MTFVLLSLCCLNLRAPINKTANVNIKLISSVQDWRSTPIYCQLQSRVTRKLGVLCRNLKIRGHLPVRIINGGGDSS